MHLADPRAIPSRSSRRLGGLVLGLGLVAAIVGACGGSPAASTVTQTAPPAATEPAASDAASPAGGGSGASLASVCRHLTNLKSMDYAFGVSFSNISALDDASKQNTLANLTTFVGEAPAEIQPQAAALLAFWTELAADSNSVNGDDPRFNEATTALGAWLAANC